MRGREQITWIVNSTVSYALTFTLTTILHELAHAAAGMALGRQPILYHSYVLYQDPVPPSRWAVTISAGAGPALSLLQGLVLMLLYPRVSLPGAVRLIILWLGLHGLVNFFGYLMTVMFGPDGDIGTIAAVWNWPFAARVVSFAAGLAGIMAVARVAARRFLELAPEDSWRRDGDRRVRWLLWVAVLPWLAASLLLMVVNLPPPHWLVLAYVFFSGVFTLPAQGFARGLAGTEGITTPPAPRIFWSVLWMTLVVLLVYRFGLAQGVRLAGRLQSRVVVTSVPMVEGVRQDEGSPRSQSRMVRPGLTGEQAAT